MNEYKRLGDYIREVNVRNRDLKVTNLLGLSMSKQFRPSTSNIVGVNLSNYKVVCKNVFAFDTMSVIRVHKVPIALNNTDSPIIVSPAYITFECIDIEKLDPLYLMMWFSRSEFDRYADFKSDAAVRGGYDWTELCDTMVYIPSIERQREIVAEYETLTRRIRLNEQIIQNLETTAQTLYHKMFVDGIEKENLPEGWRLGTIGEEVEVIDNRGKTPLIVKRETEYPLIEIAAIRTQGYLVDYDKCEKWVSKLVYESWFRSGHPKRKDILISTVGSLAEMKVFWAEKGCIAQNIVAFRSVNSSLALFLYHYLLDHKNDLLAYEIGSVQASIKVSQLINYKIVIPSFDVLNKFNNCVSCLYDSMALLKRTISVLKKLQSLLLAKIGQ